MTEQNFRCNPPHSCFSCPLPDCILDSDETPEESNFVTRHAHRKGSHNEAYEWYVAHGICVRCRKRPALPGKVLCIECKEKRARMQNRGINRKMSRNSNANA